MSKGRKKQRISNVIKNNIFMLRAVAKHTPDFFWWMIIHELSWSVMASVTALFSFNLLNTVSDGTDFLYAATLIGLQALFYLLVYAYDKAYKQMRYPILCQKLHLKMHEELFEKARSLDLSCFDDPEFYNDFVWAMDQSDKKAIKVLEDTGRFISRIIASGTLFSLIASVDAWIAIILFVSSCITIACRLVANKIEYRHDKDNNPLWRKKNYINRVYHLADHAKELRVSRADELLMRDYDKNAEKIISNNLKYGKIYFLLYSIGWGAVGNLTFYAILIYLLCLLFWGDASVGAFAATFGVISKVRWNLSDMIARITAFGKYSLYIEKYREFLRYTSKITKGDRIIPPFEYLEFKNVSFSYDFSGNVKYGFHDEDHAVPKSMDEKREVLKNVNITVRAGEKIAIVGYNGAGKTTLIKLMMRLYDPSEGEILYNGINIKDFDPDKYRERIGAVFQDFRIFAASIAENVMHGEYNESRDKECVEQALEMSDFTSKLSSLSDGIDTQLTREFDDKGTNLSGGESQKVAIARVFARDYPIVIMDEPSSALDPMAEYNLNRSILTNTKYKTVIFISHRLSTTRVADKIYMFDSGALIEEGSHEELLRINGKYAEMFRVQSEKYKNGCTRTV